MTMNDMMTKIIMMIVLTPTEYQRGKEEKERDEHKDYCKGRPLVLVQCNDVVDSLLNEIQFVKLWKYYSIVIHQLT